MDEDAVVWMTATDVAGQVRGGRLDPDDVVRCHLDRIRRLNPGLGAYVHVEESVRPGTGSLAGVTVAVKDSQPVAGMPWTWGSRRWRDRIAVEDAVPVRRARDLGAAILGKTNTPEVAASVSTVNDIFGATQSPWRRGFTPGGSSGGSAAAVAAGLCALAYGDDMGGSIRIPASCCGVFGLRPSRDRVPQELPEPVGLSVRGPLARSVADLRLALSVMAGEEPRHGTPGRLRVAAILNSPVPVDGACMAACRRAADALEAAGHRILEAAWDPLPVAHAYQVVRPCSVATLPGEPEDYGAPVGRLIAQGRAVSARDFLSALEGGIAAALPLHHLLEEHDAILTPTLGRLPMPIEEVPAFLQEAWISYTQFVLPVSFAGLPAASVPAGLHDGLPVGVQLAGPARGEWGLLDLAAELEAQAGFSFLRPP